MAVSFCLLSVTAMDLSFSTSTFQKLLFAKLQTTWLETTKALSDCMNRGLSQEMFVELGRWFLSLWRATDLTQVCTGIAI